jgi:hypothetical protein
MTDPNTWPSEAWQRIEELEAEREAASQDYADLLKDYRALRKACEHTAYYSLDNVPEEVRRVAKAALEAE